MQERTGKTSKGNISDDLSVPNLEGQGFNASHEVNAVGSIIIGLPRSYIRLQDLGPLANTKEQSYPPSR